MIRRFVPLLVLVIAAAPLVAQPQPAAPPSVPIIVNLLPDVDDENFGKELKLTPEQVKKFVEFRKKQWDEQYTTAPAEYAKGEADRDKATVALFKEVLSAEQHKRAGQLAAQKAWGNFNRFVGFGGPGSVLIPPPDVTKASAPALNSYAELAGPLKLTDEQKKLAAAGGNRFGRFAATVFLTAEQSKVAKELLGEPVKTTWNSAFDQRQNTFFGGRFGGALGLTEAKDVRTEIAMTDEQVKTLAPLLTKWQPLIGGGGGGFPGGGGGTTVSAEARAKQVAELTAETDKALATTLKPEQLTRLRQIEQQTNSGFGGFGGQSVAVPLSSRLRTLTVDKALAVTDEQDKAFAAADKALDDAITTAVAADGSVDDAIKAVTAAHDGREKAYTAVLTAEQTKKLNEMLGKPFAGNTQPDRFTTGIDPNRRKQIRTVNFGQRTIVELTLLSLNPSIQDDLKLSPEQIKKATDAATEYRTKFRPGGGFDTPAPTADEQAKAAAERSGFIAKAVEGILTADQAKRHRELMLHRAEFGLTQNQVGLNTAVGAVGYPGVAEAVKLTAEQKKKLLDDGAKPDEVLTADQKTAIKGMLGKEFKGNFQMKVGGPGFRNTTPTTATVLLNVSWDVFKLTPEQVAKLVPVANEYQLETMPRAGGGPGGQIPPAALVAANEKLAKALADILTPEQAKRVEQVRYQLVAVSGTAYLTNAEVAKALDLKDEQKAKVATAMTDMQRLQTAAYGPSPFFDPRGQGWLPKLSEKTTALATAVLTEEQIATWKKLTGDPVPNLPPNLAQPAGFGGFGGGGFPGGF